MSNWRKRPKTPARGFSLFPSTKQRKNTPICNQNEEKPFVREVSPHFDLVVNMYKTPPVCIARPKIERKFLTMQSSTKLEVDEIFSCATESKTDKATCRRGLTFSSYMNTITQFTQFNVRVSVRGLARVRAKTRILQKLQGTSSR